MIIILEGSNKVGKTTAIKHILNTNENTFLLNERQIKNKATVNNYLQLPDDIIPDYTYNMALLQLEIIKKVAKQYDPLIIFDRFHFSEIIYGKMYRRYFNHNMYTIDFKLKQMNAKMILITSKYKHIQSDAERIVYLKLQEEFLLYLDEIRLDVEVITLDNKIVNGELVDTVELDGIIKNWKEGQSNETYNRSI